jgi:hypothetical protein
LIQKVFLSESTENCKIAREKQNSGDKFCSRSALLSAPTQLHEKFPLEDIASYGHNAQPHEKASTRRKKYAKTKC